MNHSMRRAAALCVFFVVGLAAFAVGPKAYVGLFKDNAVAVIDTDQQRVLSTIPVPKGPHGLAISPDGATVYVSSDGDSRVSVIDTATDAVRASLSVGTSPHGLAITPDGSTLLVAVFGENAVVFIDTATARITGRLPVASPHNIAISPDGTRAYAAAQGKGNLAIVVMDIRGMKQVGLVPLEKTPRAIGVDPAGKKLYFTLAGSDAVQVLETSSGSIVRQIPVGASPHHPLFTAGGPALVVSQGPGTLSLIDPASDSVSAVVKVGTLPHWVSVTPDGRFAYVTNESSNDVSVVDLSARKTVATIPVGNAPRKMVIQPAAVRTTISGFTFQDTISVVAGSTVTWTNADPVPHTVSADDGTWGSEEIPPGAAFSQRFDRAGTYAYHCGMHPAMQGTVIVKQAM
jgi:YVTN family beta-propeller protein